MTETKIHPGDALSYVVDNFRLLYATGDMAIDYGPGGNAPLVIRERVDEAFYADASDIDPRKVVWKKWREVSIPFLQADDAGGEIISVEEGRVVIHHDIIFAAFYFLSGWHERFHARRDALGRVTYEGSVIKRLGIIGLPVVNYYFDILAEALSRLGVPLRERPWGDHPFAMMLTHDVDTCRGAWLEGSYSELKKGRLLSIPRLCLKRLLGRDDWFNFETIMEIDERAGARSSFYFLPRRGKAGGLKNADYNMDDKCVRRAIAAIGQRGHEVGVHGSAGTHVDGEALGRDARAVHAGGVTGNRFHFLMFDPGETPGVLAANGICYDTTLGFAERAGFRRGCCTPFFLFDFNARAASPVLEIPLVVMDATLRGERYMHLNREEAFETIASLLEAVGKVNGLFTLLWHNTFFSDYKYTGWREVYTRVLERARENGALFINGQEVYERITGK
jgi:hypothetical protein